MRACTPAFVAALAQSPRASRTPTARCSRRSLLFALPAIAGSAAGFLAHPREVRASEEPSANTDARGKVSGEASLFEFVQQLEGGRVAAVWFYGTFADYCVFQTEDGKFLHIGEGYPAESARSPESPLQIAAKVRNFGVPYFSVPVETKFLKR